MVHARRVVESQNGALMQTLRVCVRQRRCLCAPPRGYAPPWNPRSKASRPRHPGSEISIPDTLDIGRAYPLTQPGGIPSPSTPDQPGAVWMRASALPLWTGPLGALLPENPAPETSLSRTLDDRCAGQSLAAIPSHTASGGLGATSRFSVVSCLP